MGDLCALTTNYVESLPFRVPKFETFFRFMDKFDELNEKKRLKFLKKTIPIMGSVKEEMNKLEESTCLDISIECETLKEEINLNKSQTSEPHTEVNKKGSQEFEPSQKNSSSIKIDDFDMEIDMERTVSEENASTTTVKDALEKAVHIYKNYIMTNTSRPN